MKCYRNLIKNEICFAKDLIDTALKGARVVTSAGNLPLSNKKREELLRIKNKLSLPVN